MELRSTAFNDHTPPGRNGIGDLNWDGPQPPPGDNAYRYFLRLVALRDATRLQPGFSTDELRDRIETRAVDRATLFGLYQKEA